MKRKHGRGRKARDQKKKEEECDEVVPVGRPLLAHGMFSAFMDEHQTVQLEDHCYQPLHQLSHALREKQEHFSNLGLTLSSKPRFQLRSGYVMHPLPVRTAVLKTGVLPFTSPSVIPFVGRSDKMADDVATSQTKLETQLSRSILWPDPKFRSHVLQQVGVIPDDSAEFQDRTWIAKRKRVSEMLKKWKAQKEEKELDRILKRKKFISKLKEYPERELRGMFPRLNQEAVVPVELVTRGRCEECRAPVYQVEEQIFHKCQNTS